MTPHPPGQDPPGTPNPRTGELDYVELFKADAPWQRAASYVHVFKFYPQVINKLSDDELRPILADLDRRGIAIALEVGSLRPTTCGLGVEGFNGSDGPQVARRLKSLGRTLSFAALDEPYFYASLYEGPNACRWTAEHVARETASWSVEMRAIFPDIQIGDIEPLASPADVARYENWLETYRSVNGRSFPFFHLDVDFTRPNWPQESKALEAFARDHGISFGMIYIGNGDDQSDGVWVNHAADRMAIYEEQTAGRPDHVVIQSWHDRPHHALPETDPTTFTSLVNRYFATRTSLRLDLGTSSGTLQDKSGAGIGGASIALKVRPLDGPGLYSEFSLTGTVPTGVRQGVIQIDLLAKPGATGPIDIALYEARYEESGAPPQPTNASFSAGLSGWGGPSAALAVVRVERSDRGSGSMLHLVSATSLPPGSFVNSSFFPVRPGASYTATFRARVSPSSVGAGSFAMIFLAERETSRVVAPFDSAATTAAATTDATGRFKVVLPATGRVGVDARYDGDATRWPAFATAER